MLLAKRTSSSAEAEPPVAIGDKKLQNSQLTRTGPLPGSRTGENPRPV